MIPQKNYYFALLCRPGDDAPTLKRAYRRIVKHAHADANTGSEQYRVLCEAAVEAWEVLGEATKRKEYDAARAQWLQRLGAVWCQGCGNGLRLPDEGEGLRCPICKTPVEELEPEPEPKSAWKSSVVEPLVESGVRIGGTVVDASEREAERLGRELMRQSAQLLSGLISSGFDVARQKLKRKGRLR